MEPEITDFKDWYELKDRKKEFFFLNGESFCESIYVKNCYVKKGMSVFVCGKEVFRAWTGKDSSGKKQNLLALLLEDGSWAVSVPFYEEKEISALFNMTEDFQNQSIKISVLTNAGWKSRIVKIK